MRRLLREDAAALQHIVDVMTDAAQQNSPYLDDVIEQFTSEFSGAFGADVATLLDKGRMTTYQARTRFGEGQRGIAAARREINRSLQVVQNHHGFLSSNQASERSRTIELAHYLAIILICVRYIQEEGARETGGVREDMDMGLRPEPMDPNDRVRQQTQSRAGSYPYDAPVSYGQPQHTGMDGSSYSDLPGVRDDEDSGPLGRQSRPDRPMSAWDRISDGLSPTMSQGEQGDMADELGYGSHGRMGESLAEFFIVPMTRRVRRRRLSDVLRADDLNSGEESE